MPLADLLPGRGREAGRLPSHIGDLAGPARGVIVLPRQMAWPGFRECDVTDDAARRGMYVMVLSQGTRNDIARFLNAALLREDWPHISRALESGLRRKCERRYALGRRHRPAATEQL
jgi:hypothetical protein